MSTTFDLVVQGQRIDDTAIAELARLCGATDRRRLAPGAVRFVGARRDAAIADACASLALDCAWVPAEVRLADYGLVAMDMDSTLITIECIDELADIAGIKPQVAEITESAMRGEIDFGESLTRRVALLAGLDVSAFERVYDERLQLSPGAERLIAGLKARGIRTLLVSGGFTFFTERLKARLGLDYACSNEPEIVGGKLTGRIVGPIVDAAGKAEKVQAVREALGLTSRQVIVIGDGANDLAMMAEAGVSIAYRAKPVVQRQATYSLTHVGLDGLLNLFLL
jgi:phosphoserine phosphatase